jgi:hypothetical protein
MTRLKNNGLNHTTPKTTKCLYCNKEASLETYEMVNGIMKQSSPISKCPGVENGIHLYIRT